MNFKHDVLMTRHYLAPENSKPDVLMTRHYLAPKNFKPDVPVTRFYLTLSLSPMTKEASWLALSRHAITSSSMVNVPREPPTKGIARPKEPSIENIARLGRPSTERVTQLKTLGTTFPFICSF